MFIDYHNLNCDGNVAPPAELDNVVGRPCYPEYKNVGPTPGDSSEIAIEGNFMEDYAIHPDGTGGCYATFLRTTNSNLGHLKAEQHYPPLHILR